MFLRIHEKPVNTLVGMHARMSFQHDETVRLWRSFMPRRAEVKNRVGLTLIDLKIYPGLLSGLAPDMEFEKWVGVEVAGNDVPAGMEMLTIPAGTYAVFRHRGPAWEAPKIFGYIFNEWLPTSSWMLDNRPHFDVMREGYRPDDAAAEEEIWIPVIKA